MRRKRDHFSLNSRLLLTAAGSTTEIDLCQGLGQDAAGPPRKERLGKGQTKGGETALDEEKIVE
jgi:hypothetical protein